MENTLGVEWFKKVFIPNSGTTRPQLLLLDSHTSHEVLELLELAKEQQIHVFALPPHTTHRLQPLDTNLFMPFKAKYNEACTEFMNANPSKVIDKHSFPLMLKEAWSVFSSTEKIKKSFRTTGIWPLNPAAISEETFAPAVALSRPMSTTAAIEEHDQEHHQDIMMPSTSGNVIITEDQRPIHYQNIRSTCLGNDPIRNYG